MKIINNSSDGDYHIHSSTFSDGFNSIDEIVVEAGKLNLKEIAITDHSQDLLDSYGMAMKTHYNILSIGRWQNIHNSVNVLFGVEADLLNESGDVGDHIQGISPDFMSLSVHLKVYKGDLSSIKKGYLKAFSDYGSRIRFLGHLCSADVAQHLSTDDVRDIVIAANETGIACELNCANLVHQKTSEAHLRVMLSHCNVLYVNSDAHTLWELRHIREAGFTYLKNNHYY